jgi:hypothetical protein
MRCDRGFFFIIHNLLKVIGCKKVRGFERKAGIL